MGAGESLDGVAIVGVAALHLNREDGSHCVFRASTGNPKEEALSLVGAI
jgi:hypothetical protein